MATLDRLQRQLASLGELRDIVRTMKALSAANIRQYEEAVEALTGYYRTVERGLQVVLRERRGEQKPPARRTPAAAVAAVVFGSDHGLCGRFNETVTAHALTHRETVASNPASRQLLAVGARAAASLAAADQTVTASCPLPGSAAQITAAVQRILVQLDRWRADDRAHRVYLYYNRPNPGQGYRPVAVELLPVNVAHLARTAPTAWPSRSLPTFSMDREALLSRLLYQYLFVTVFRACAESQAGEHASRLAAMQAAERNLDGRLGELTTDFRRARQGAITAELLDVVAGYEAITGGRRHGKRRQPQQTPPGTGRP